MSIHKLKEMWLCSNGINPESTKQITVEPMSAELHCYHNLIQSKQCYDNSFRLLCELQDARYVLGLGLYCIPIDHAWIKHKGKYYDPTWQLHTQELREDYLSVFEFCLDELLVLIEKNDGIPPSLADMRKLLKNQHPSIINQNQSVQVNSNLVI